MVVIPRIAEEGVDSGRSERRKVMWNPRATRPTAWMRIGNGRFMVGTREDMEGHLLRLLSLFYEVVVELNAMRSIGGLVRVSDGIGPPRYCARD